LPEDKIWVIVTERILRGFMHKLQRIAQILAASRGETKIVFERRVKSVKFYKSKKPNYHAEVYYWTTTNFRHTAKGEGKTPLQALRSAWKAAKKAFDESLVRDAQRYGVFEFDEVNLAPTENVQALGHNLSMTRDGFFRCSICDRHYVNIPDFRHDKCPEAPFFHGAWDKAFKEAEEALGFKPLTKKQLDQAGFQTGKKLPKPCAAFDYSDNPTGFLLAYSPLEATPKKTMSEAEKAALVKAKYMAERVYVRCVKCEHNSITMTRKKSLDPKWTEFICDACCDGLEAGKWAHDVLANPDNYAILDTETTSLSGEIIDLGILSLKGKVLLNQRIKPVGEMSEGAQAIHGISLEMLANEPSFVEVYPRILEAIGDKTLIIYSASFDMGILCGDCHRHGLPKIKNESECAMYEYARFYGEWSNYWGNYKWQPLYGGDHSAIGDCRATLSLLKRMAKDYEKWRDKITVST
jgi:DNA polymerase III epsilon subunit-like protein